MLLSVLKNLQWKNFSDGKKLNGSSDWIKKDQLSPQQSLYNETISLILLFRRMKKNR